MLDVSRTVTNSLACYACASSRLPPSGANPRPLHDIGRPKDSKMHRASLRPLLQHLHPLRHTNYVRCLSQLCSLWRRFESDLEILDTGIELLQTLFSDRDSSSTLLSLDSCRTRLVPHPVIRLSWVELRRRARAQRNLQPRPLGRATASTNIVRATVARFRWRSC